MQLLGSKNPRKYLKYYRCNSCRAFCISLGVMTILKKHARMFTGLPARSFFVGCFSRPLRRLTRARRCFRCKSSPVTRALVIPLPWKFKLSAARWKFPGHVRMCGVNAVGRRTQDRFFPRQLCREHQRSAKINVGRICRFLSTVSSETREDNKVGMCRRIERGALTLVMNLLYALPYSCVRNKVLRHRIVMALQFYGFYYMGIRAHLLLHTRVCEAITRKNKKLQNELLFILIRFCF